MIEIKDLKKSYGAAEILKGVSFDIKEGETVVIIGKSGSGKTTLLRCLNFLERPNGGTITVNGETLFDASTAGMEKDADLRRKRLHFGMVFQAFHLFPQYTAWKMSHWLRSSWHRNVRIISRIENRSSRK